MSSRHSHRSSGHHSHKSSGRTGSSSSTKAHSSHHTQAPRSFLFAVNELSINDDPNAGGTVPLYDHLGHWSPPLYRNGFGPQNIGTLYRWQEGVISQVFNCAPTVAYRQHSMFWCDGFNQFLTVPGDATQDNVGEDEQVHFRWWPLSFRNEGTTTSRLIVSGEDIHLASRNSAWINGLGLNAHVHSGAPHIGELSGNLAILVGLIAFSCEPGYLDAVLMMDQAWDQGIWHGHHQGPHGRYEQRGVVVKIYLDPANPQGSTNDSLYALEWNEPALMR